MILYASGNTDQTANTFLGSDTAIKTVTGEGTHHKFCGSLIPLIPSEIHRHLCPYKAGESVSCGQFRHQRRGMERVYTPATTVPRKTAPRVKGMLVVIAFEQERKKMRGREGE